MSDPLALADALEQIAGIRATEGRLPVTPHEQVLIDAAVMLRELGSNACVGVGTVVECALYRRRVSEDTGASADYGVTPHPRHTAELWS